MYFLSVIWVCALIVSKSRKSKYLNEKDIERKFTQIITKQLENALKAGNGVFVFVFVFVSELKFCNYFTDPVSQKRRHSIGETTPVYNVIEKTFKLATAPPLPVGGMCSPWTGKIERNV